MTMANPADLVKSLFSNPTDLAHVSSLTTSDLTYISLNFDNPELKKVLPWAGTSRGPQSVVNAAEGIARVWEILAFEFHDVVANGDAVAMFGSFTYKTRTLGKEITSPFSVLAKVRDGKISYMQFLEDTFGTAASFRASGTWHFRGVATGGDVDVG
jgi:ketosteroid isomerase-like protein